MRKNRDKLVTRSGFSLAEVLAALTIGSMVLVAILAIHGRAERSTAALTNKLDSFRLPGEVMQRIAEDLDRIIESGSDTRVTVENKFQDGYNSARLKIRRTYRDKNDKLQTFEEIIWQTAYDYDSDANGLVLYRSHSGLAAEDKLLDKDKEDWERELFVPMCTGVTLFKIQIPADEEPLDRWAKPALPHGLIITISFTEPFKMIDGTLDVPDEEKTIRTIAIDRTRKIKFVIAEKPDSNEPTNQKNQKKPTK